ncbi:hypothetical protein SH601_06925 [Gracilibacillus sp. S3-1-1]|uniref:Uncharacterized protein n=1 Tax=Gracilibacillus pellucidus TaxID=3095368 RepID=A0ACC6M434_9BACI|nr:hypothetical protein [Gracilibacillus sp. S3-1-1]MDX8045719.1 hypothetical protein [Gracilibacillus sp. S3-1-1]
MELLIEAGIFSLLIVASILIARVATKKGRNYAKNIRKLSKQQWFKEFTNTYTPLFVQHDAYRSFIANANVEEVIRDEAKQALFKREILQLMAKHNL